MPVPARISIAQIGLAHEPAVRHIDQPVGNGDADVHLLCLIAPLVLVGPPHAGPVALAGGGDPDAACRILLESQSAEAANLLRMSGVIKVNGLDLPGVQSLRKIDEDRA